MTSIIQQQQTTSATTDDGSSSNDGEPCPCCFNPIPSTLPHLIVTRIGTNPDMFILKNFMNPIHCNALIQYALEEAGEEESVVSRKNRPSQPSSSLCRDHRSRRRTKYDREPWFLSTMEKNNHRKNRLRPAYTTNGEIRYNSQLCWIRPQQDEVERQDIENEKEGSIISDTYTTPPRRSVIEETAYIIAQAMTDLSSYLVLPRSTTTDEHEIMDGFIAEDLQLVRYTTGGSFELHRDAASTTTLSNCNNNNCKESNNKKNSDKTAKKNNKPRFVTCLTYLNGVGGTWFPFAQNDIHNSDDCSDGNNEALEKEKYLSNQMIPGQDGLWIIGSEVVEEEESSEVESEMKKTKNIHVVRIKPGDAIVFYNYTAIRNDTTTDDENNNDDDDDEGSTMITGITNWRAEHLGMEVPTHTEEKWIATNWFGYE